jgi:hypothetical protein
MSDNTTDNDDSNRNDFAAAFASIDVPHEVDERAARLVAANPEVVREATRREERDHQLNELITQEDWARNIRYERAGERGTYHVGTTWRNPTPSERLQNHVGLDNISRQIYIGRLQEAGGGGEGSGDGDGSGGDRSGDGDSSSSGGGGAGRGHGGGRGAGRGGGGRGTETVEPPRLSLSGGRQRFIRDPISYQEMIDGVVDEKVASQYCNEIIRLMDWAYSQQQNWLGEAALQSYPNLAERLPTENCRQHRQRIKQCVTTMLQNARTNAVFNLENITPKRLMEYLASQANSVTGKALGIGSYNSKRSAFRHLFRLHNGAGYPPDFEDELKMAWRGFTRRMTKETALQRTHRRSQQRRAAAATNADNDEDDSDDEDDGDDEASIKSASSLSDVENDREDFKEGKEPMSPELFRFLCKKAVMKGTQEYLFLACFLIWTWNLVCRGYNTARVRLSHITCSSEDFIGAFFRHTKSDQTGDQKRQQRNLYSNPHEPFIDLFFVSALYLACCFQNKQSRGRKLFPGPAQAQAKRASVLLQKLLKENEADVLAMGYDSIKDIGLHSIRKGSASTLASLPGGPSAAAICLRAGWTMGKIRDIYFRWMETGDHFTGRCASLLNMYRKDFGSSPVLFDGVDPVWVTQAVKDNFPCFSEIDGLSRMLVMFLASLTHHRAVVGEFPPSHIARTIPLFRDGRNLIPAIEKTTIRYAWEGTHTATGVPPHIKQLIELEVLRSQSNTLVTDVTKSLMDSMQEYFEQQEIGQDITIGRVRGMIEAATQQNVSNLVGKFNDGLDKLTKAFEQSQQPTNRGATGTADNTLPANRQPRNVMAMGAVGGRIQRLPSSWRFPHGGPYQLWTVYNIGDSEKRVPALRLLNALDFKFLDTIPLSDEEKRGKRGPNAGKRRASRRTYNDMIYLCKYIEEKAVATGLSVGDHRSVEDVRRMYEVASEHFKDILRRRGNERCLEQGKWSTVVKSLRQRDLLERRAAASS